MTRQRLKVWAARAVLSLPLVAALVFFTQLPVHDSSHYWPFGHIHNVAEAVLVLLAYVAGTVLCFLVTVCLCGELYLTLYTIMRTARRKPHLPWRKRWDRLLEPKDRPPMVHYDKPPPLVRGRIGSK